MQVLYLGQLGWRPCLDIFCGFPSFRRPGRLILFPHCARTVPMIMVGIRATLLVFQSKKKFIPPTGLPRLPDDPSRRFSPGRSTELSLTKLLRGHQSHTGAISLVRLYSYRSSFPRAWEMPQSLRVSNISCSYKYM